MKKLSILCLGLSFMVIASTSVMAASNAGKNISRMVGGNDNYWGNGCGSGYGYGYGTDITHEIPEIDESKDAEMQGFKKIEDRAQYKESDWSKAIGIARNISLSKAFQIANNNPEITYFFYTKGYQMVLEKQDGTYRVFRHGDTVFFSGEPWWGTAPGLADGYIRQ